MSTARAVVAKSIADFVTRAGGIITFPILARFAGVEGYGAYGQVNTLIAFALPFASLGLGGAMVRFFAGESWTLATRARLSRTLLVVLVASGFVGLLMAASAETLNDLVLRWPGGGPLFFWGGFLVVAGALQQCLFDFLRAQQRFILLSSLQFAEAVLYVAAVFVLLPSGFELAKLFQAVLVIKAGLVAVALLGFWSWDVPEKGFAPERFAAPIASMITFGLPVAVTGLGLWMMHLGDRLVIGHVMSPAALGLYGAVYTASLLLSAINSPVSLPLYPRLMKAFAGGQAEEVAREVRTFHRYAILLLVPSTVFLVLMMNPLLVLMGGREFRADGVLIAMIVLPIFVQQWNTVAHYTLLCVDRTVFAQNLWLTGGAINVIGNLFAVPAFGLHGAAFMTLATFLALDAAVYLDARRFVPLGSLYRFDVTWKAALSSTVAAAAVFLVGEVSPKLSAIALDVAVFGGTYLLCCVVLFREIGRSDLQMLAHAFAFRH
jgi:O-antigen/teichoic acid export membrane protein